LKILKILSLGAVLAPAIAFSAPGFALSEGNGHLACALTAGHERVQSRIEQVDLSPAVRCFAAEFSASRKNRSLRSIRVSCIRQFGGRPKPGGGWFYKGRHAPAIDACVAAALNAANGGKRR
jgi:hypothetical protein